MATNGGEAKTTVTRERHQLLASSWAPLWREETRYGVMGQEKARVASIPPRPRADVTSAFFPEDGVTYADGPLQVEDAIRRRGNVVRCRRVALEPWVCMATAVSEGVVIAYWSTFLVLDVERADSRTNPVDL